MLSQEDLRQIRSVVRDEVKNEIKTALKPVNRKLNRVQKDIGLLLKYNDENVIRLRGRIERLEEHTGLSRPS